MKHEISIQWDEEANVWYAICDSIPLALENDSLDILIGRIKIVALEILAENGKLSKAEKLVIRVERQECIA